MSFWPTKEHWSVGLPLRTNHYLCPSLETDGFVLLTPYDGEIPKEEWESLEYFDWKSGGDTNFAPLASADGELECRGFWDKGKPDKGATWTVNAEKAPTLQRYVNSIGANFGRVRIIKLEPATHEVALRSFHRDDNNRLNPEGEGWVLRTWIELTDDPDSYMLLMDLDENNLPDPTTERRIPLPQYSRFVVDTQRLWHVVVHRHDHPRYALITSVESTPELEGWIQSQVPALV
ncbi:MAG: hypothetical protein M9961_03655 [Ilumatobacteraceae bacterium]|nr:hypothetical protein [Ilumatobacteraceae bacterium]